MRRLDIALGFGIRRREDDFASGSCGSERTGKHLRRDARDSAPWGSGSQRNCKKAIWQSSALVRIRFWNFALSEERSGSASLNLDGKSGSARSSSEVAEVFQASSEVADANSMRTVEHNFAEHPALFQLRERLH